MMRVGIVTLPFHFNYGGIYKHLLYKSYTKT